MTVLEMSRPMHPFGFDGARPHTHSLSPESSSASSYPSFARSMNMDKLPPIRDLFPFFGRRELSQQQQQQQQQYQHQHQHQHQIQHHQQHHHQQVPAPPKSGSLPSLSLASNSPNTASAPTPEYTHAHQSSSAALEHRRSMIVDDEPTATAHRTASRVRHGGSQINQVPRMYSDLPRLDTSSRTVDSGTAAMSVSSSRGSSSGYGGSLPFDYGGGGSDHGRSLDSPPLPHGRDAHGRAYLPPASHSYPPPPLPPPPASSSSSSSSTQAHQQQQPPPPLPYHHHRGRPSQSSQSSQSYPPTSSAGPHASVAYGSSPYQQHPSRMQSLSSDSTRSYAQPHQQLPQQVHHQPHQPYQPQQAAPDYPPADYYSGARHRGHDLSPHPSTRHRHGSISKTTKKRRGNLPKEFTDMFQDWLYKHMHHPYPSDEEKHEFIRRTGLDMNQVSNWFINARRRKLPDMVRNLDGDVRHPHIGPNDDMLE